jgi:trk system potassium uptake protein
LATLFVVLVSRRLGLRARLIAQAQTRLLSVRDVRRVVRNVTVFSFASEVVIASVLAARLATAHGMSGSAAAYEGFYHAVSAFNNAGFALYDDSMVRYVGDPWILLPIVAAVIVGGLGFPVVFELSRSWRRPRSWSVMTRITVYTTATLLLVGTALLLALERDNPGTLGPLPLSEKLLAGFFSAVMPRSAGFNAIDIAAMHPESRLIIDVLMFIGGGSAGTAGGIKVTTFGLLMMVLWAEIRGESYINVGGRQVPESNHRQALAVALLGLGLALASTYALLYMTDHDLDSALFEAVSAVGTVGLSTGMTRDLPAAAKLFLAMLMFVGRLGPLSVASALALRQRGHRYAYPEEGTTVG